MATDLVSNLGRPGVVCLNRRSVGARRGQQQQNGSRGVVRLFPLKRAARARGTRAIGGVVGVSDGPPVILVARRGADQLRLPASQTAPGLPSHTCSSQPPVRKLYLACLPYFLLPALPQRSPGREVACARARTGDAAEVVGAFSPKVPRAPSPLVVGPACLPCPHTLLPSSRPLALPPPPLLFRPGNCKGPHRPDLVTRRSLLLGSPPALDLSDDGPLLPSRRP